MKGKIVVPEGMMKAAQLAAFDIDVPVMEFMYRAVEAALLWLSENPAVPTEDQGIELQLSCPRTVRYSTWCATEWQRRMFLAPVPEVPEEIKDLLHPTEFEAAALNGKCAVKAELANQAIIEAFHRGQKAGK